MLRALSARKARIPPTGPAGIGTARGLCVFSCERNHWKDRTDEKYRHIPAIRAAGPPCTFVPRQEGKGQGGTSGRLGNAVKRPNHATAIGGNNRQWAGNGNRNGGKKA